MARLELNASGGYHGRMVHQRDKTAVRMPAGILGSALALLAVTSGCATGPPEGESDVHAKLSRVGIRLLDEDTAAVPSEERGKYLPCRVVPGFPRPALPDHPAGYLLVSVTGEEEAGAGAIRRALAAWKVGELLEVRVRRNPFLASESEWWEKDVRMYLPPR